MLGLEAASGLPASEHCEQLGKALLCGGFRFGGTPIIGIIVFWVTIKGPCFWKLPGSNRLKLAAKLRLHDSDQAPAKDALSNRSFPQRASLRGPYHKFGVLFLGVLRSF